MIISIDKRSLCNKIRSEFENKEKLEKDLILTNCLVSLVFVPGFSLLNFYNLALFFLMLCLVLSCSICCLNLKKRIVLLFFYLAMFLFLVTRILVPAVKGWDWWLNYSPEANCFAVIAISISIFFLLLGTLLMERYIKKKGETLVQEKWFDKKSLKQVLRAILFVCMICACIMEIEKLVFMQGRAYEEYYISYVSKMPFPIYFPAGCVNFFLCAFLALLPSKKESFIWLSVYILLAVQMLLIGIRNPIMLRCVFAFLYYFLRDIIRKKDEIKWIGKWETRLLIFSVPILIVFLGMYNYTRDNVKVDMSPVEVIVDFCYKQGTTYDTVLQGYMFREQLPNREDKVYTIGALQEEILYNSLGKKLFKANDIGSGNSVKRATEGKTFSHAISYVVMGEEYLNGHGRGSSFIIENYVDFGYLGIVLYSVLLGGICSYIALSFGKRWIMTVIGLMILTNIFFTPRAEATAFLCFLVSYKFWFCIIGCLILGRVWQNREVIVKRIKRL